MRKFFLPLFLLIGISLLIKTGGSKDDDINTISFNPPEVRIIGVNPSLSVEHNPQFEVNTNEGLCNIKTDCNFNYNSAFSDRQKDDVYSFGFSTPSIIPQDCSLWITCPFPLENYGCYAINEYNDTECDLHFEYKDLTIDLESLERKNPKMNYSVQQLDKKATQFRIDFENIQDLDPVVYSSPTLTITTDSYTCDTLNQTIGANYPDTFQDIFNCYDSWKCNLTTKIVLDEDGGLTIGDHCNVEYVGAQMTGQRDEALIYVKNGFFHMNASGNITSKDPTQEFSIWAGENGAFDLRDSYINEVGDGAGDERFGVTVESYYNNVTNVTISNGKWALNINYNAYETGSSLDLPPPSSLGSFNNFSYNIIGEGEIVKGIQLWGSDSNSIDHNIVKRFTIDGMTVNPSTYTIKNVIPNIIYNYYSNNNSLSNNFIDGAGNNAQNGIVSHSNLSLFSFNEVHNIKYDTASRTSTCSRIRGNDNKILHTYCEQIGGIGVNENGVCLGVNGNRNYINGTNCDWIGGNFCSNSRGIELSNCDNCISENNLDVELDSLKACGVGYYIDEFSDNNYINENGLDLMNNDPQQIVGMWIEGSGNTFENIKIRTGNYGSIGVWLDGADENTFVNLDCEIDNNPYSCVNLGGDCGSADNNKFVDSKLVCKNYCGTDNTQCDLDNEYGYAITGDYNSRDNTAGNFRQTLLNTTYTEWCTDEGADNYQLEIQWKVRAYVNDSYGNPLNNINITAWNNTIDEFFNELTQADGYINSQNITEKIQNGTADTWYWTNYTINATDSEGLFNFSSKSVNITNNMLITFTLDRIRSLFNKSLNLTLIFSLVAIGGLLIYLGSLHYEPLNLILNASALYIFIIAANIFTVIENMPYFTTILFILQTLIFVYLAYRLISFFIDIMQSVKTKNV